MTEKQSVTMSVGASRDEIEDVLARLRAGESDRLEGLRRKHGKARADLLNLLWREEIPAERKRFLEDLLVENRLREEYIERSARAVIEDRHSTQMVELTRSSNKIAERSTAAAEALKRWTVVLAGSTVVLALVTLALIWATLQA